MLHCKSFVDYHGGKSRVLSKGIAFFGITQRQRLAGLLSTVTLVELHSQTDFRQGSFCNVYAVS